MASAPIQRLAAQLLDRLYRNAEGRTNKQLDLTQAISSLGRSRQEANPAVALLINRNFINSFGPDIAFLTTHGVATVLTGWSDDIHPPQASGDLAPNPPRKAKPAILTHVDLEGNQDSILLGWHCTVGRAENNTIVIKDQRASKYHAFLRFENGCYVLEDLGSANGTLLNGNYVIDPTPLKYDDEIVIGRTLLLYQGREPVLRPRGPKPESRPKEAIKAALAASSLPELSQDTSDAPQMSAGDVDWPQAAMRLPLQNAWLPPARPEPIPSHSEIPTEVSEHDFEASISTSSSHPPALPGAQSARVDTDPRPLPRASLSEPAIPPNLPNLPSLPANERSLDTDEAQPGSDPLSRLVAIAEALQSAPLDITAIQPEATLAVPRSSSELRLSHPFYQTLRRLKAQLPEDVESRDALLDAIDRLYGHAYVELFLLNDDD